MGIKTVLFLISCFVWAGISNAQTQVIVDGISYELKADGAYVAAAETKEVYSGDIVIPEQIVVDETTYTVVGINAKAFDGATNVVSITIPKSVISLGKNCIANLPNLSKLAFSDGTDEIKVNGTSKKDSPVFSCGIQDIYIGRSFNISSKCALLATTTIDKISFGKNIYSIPSYFLSGNLQEDAQGIFVIPEGVLEIQSNAVAINGIKHLVLPSSLRIFNSEMIYLDSDFDKDVVLESMAIEPTYFASYTDLIKAFDGVGKYRFAKLIVPNGCKEYYEACNWTGASDSIEEAEPQGAGSEPSDPVTPKPKVYVSLVMPQGENGYSYPRVQTDQGDDFVITVDVQQGWRISSASFVLDENVASDDNGTDQTSAPAYAEEDVQANSVIVDKVPEGNRYQINVKSISGDGRLSYVVEKEVPTEVEINTTAGHKAVVTVRDGDIHVRALENGRAMLYNLNGTLIDSKCVGSAFTVIFGGLDRGVYILNVGDRTYKIAL